jgi:hypothetical protein
MAAAINLTLRAIEERTRLYRGLIVVVSVSSVLALLLAAILRSGTPLLGFGLLVPFAGGYLVLDGRRVSRWRKSILDLWCERDLNLALFAKSVSAYPSVPPRTLEGMLSALPKDLADLKLDALSDTKKRQMVGASNAAERKQEARILLAVAALTLAVALAAAAAWLRSGRALVCAVLVAVTWAAVKNRL